MISFPNVHFLQNYSNISPIKQGYREQCVTNYDKILSLSNSANYVSIQDSRKILKRLYEICQQNLN